MIFSYISNLNKRLEVNILKTGIKPVLWSLLALAIGLVLLLPGLNFIALLLILVPYTVLYTQLDTKSFVAHVAVVFVIGSVIIGPTIFLISSILALIPSVFMGRYYKKGLPSVKIVPQMTGIMLIAFMLLLWLIEEVIGVSFLADMRKSMMLTLNNMASINVSPIEWTHEMSESFVTIMMSMIPFVLFVIAFVVVICSHAIARRVAISNGVVVPPFPKAKDWQLPRSLIFIYLIAYLMQFTVDPMDTSFLNVALNNLVPALSLLFSTQAIGLFFFLAHNRGWNKAVPLLIAIPIILIPPCSIIGIIDLAFPLRKSFSKQQ